MHYAAAKGGLISFTKGLAKELAPHGVRVNAVAPGVIDTPFHEEFSTPELMRNFITRHPLGRIGTPAECANAIAFLVSDAASFIVGETLEVNGGQMMREQSVQVRRYDNHIHSSSRSVWPLRRAHGRVRACGGGLLRGSRAFRS